MSTQTVNDQIAQIIFSLSRIMRDEMTFDSETSQLTMMQLQALIFIKKADRVTMGDVAEHFQITLPTVTVLLDKLVHLGLVRRDQNTEDRRVVNVKLTKKGENLTHEAMKQRRKKINHMLSYLSVEDKELLLQIMNRLMKAIQ